MSRELWIFRLISFIYYAIFIFGFIWSRPPIFASITFVVKVSMALFLFYRFNPLTDYKKFTELDREIVMFVAGFILVSSFTDYINQFVQKVLPVIRTNKDPVLTL